ncbi:MAG: pyridoxal phosphate-dependent aminotransferase [Armatimonadota bacterium]
MNPEDRFISPYVRDLAARASGGGSRSHLVNLARDMQDVISLNSGDPDLTAAPVAVEAAVEALRAGKTHYAHGGLPELRAAIARKCAAENGFTIDADRQVIITNGSAEAAAALLLTLLDAGDEVLTTDPYYTGHVSAITLARGVPIFVPTRGDDLWEPDPAEVERRITPRTKAFIFATPGNPTAAVYRPETLAALLDIAHRRNILLIPDELFERYVYDGHRHVSAASLPGAADRVVTINGFSKSYCMTGWRLGWMVAPHWLAGTLANVRYSLSMTASTANMWGAIAALSAAARPYYDEVYRTYGERRVFFYDAFTRVGLPQKPTPGAFVGMVDIRKTGRTEEQVAEKFLTDARVLVWPATVFGACGRGYLRVSLIKPLVMLQEMMRRLEPVVAGMLSIDARST